MHLFARISVLLATGARDGVINLWDLRASEGSAEQRPFASIAAAHKLTKHVGRRRGNSSHQHSVTCARFSPDGVTLLSAGVDG
jgi:WD40 repeat protein